MMIAHITRRKGCVVRGFSVAKDDEFGEGGDSETIDKRLGIRSQQRSMADQA